LQKVLDLAVAVVVLLHLWVIFVKSLRTRPSQGVLRSRGPRSLLGRSVGQQLLFLWCCAALVLEVEAVGMKRSRSASRGRPSAKAPKAKSPKASGAKATAKAVAAKAGSVRSKLKPRPMKTAAEMADRVRRHAHGIRETNPYGQVRPALNQESDERYDVGPWLLCPEDVKAIVDRDYFLPMEGWVTYIDVQSLNDDLEYTGVFRALMVDYSYCGGERYLLVCYSVGEDEEMDLDGAETYEGKLFVLHLCGCSGRRRQFPRGCKANHRNYPCLHVDRIRRVREK
jgi:hypothetical protein